VCSSAGTPGYCTIFPVFSPLGGRPTPEQRLALYAPDKQHPGKKGYAAW